MEILVPKNPNGMTQDQDAENRKYPKPYYPDSVHGKILIKNVRIFYPSLSGAVVDKKNEDPSSPNWLPTSQIEFLMNKKDEAHKKEYSWLTKLIIPEIINENQRGRVYNKKKPNIGLKDGDSPENTASYRRGHWYARAKNRFQQPFFVRKDNTRFGSPYKDGRESDDKFVVINKVKYYTEHELEHNNSLAHIYIKPKYYSYDNGGIYFLLLGIKLVKILPWHDITDEEIENDLYMTQRLKDFYDKNPNLLEEFQDETHI